MAARRTKGTGSIDYDDKKRTYRGRIKLKGKTYTVYAQSKTATQTKLNAIIAAI